MIDVRTTLLDEALPRFDVRSRHARRVAASPEAVWRAVEAYDPRRDASLIVRSLFLARGFGIPVGTIREVLAASGFTIIAERPGSEIVAGTTGRFWALRERANMAAPADLDAFLRFGRPGWAKAAVSVRVEPIDDASTDIVTETRVWCVDDHARRRFAAYWTVIGAFSGWIRHGVLRAVARKAEEER
ncbi:MAG TPA: hypothetical protein VG709_08245 [Actinomycetota bacterium]|nr:hypothetical protein [Actinomycetota bacterium]